MPRNNMFTGLMLLVVCLMAYCPAFAQELPQGQNENSIISEIQFIGESAFTSQEMFDMITTRPGDDMHCVPIGDDAELLLQANRQQNFILSNVQTSFNYQTGVLAFMLYTYEIDDFVVRSKVPGLTEARLLEALDVRIGDIYDPVKLADTARALRLRLKNIPVRYWIDVVNKPCAGDLHYYCVLYIEVKEPYGPKR